jgi:signal transduction histidine kinase
VAPQLRAKAQRYATTPARRCDATVRAIREKLRQIVLNLLSNAIKFTPPARAELRIEDRGQRHDARVRDARRGLLQRGAHGGEERGRVAAPAHEQ